MKPIMLCLAMILPASALADVSQRCGGVFDLCGLTDSQTGAEIGPQVYERILQFSEGVAPARIGGRFGYIDLTGKLVITPAYELAGPFRFGLAEVLTGKKVGLINHAGQLVLTPRFGRAIPISPHVVVAYDGDWKNGYYDGYEQLEIDVNPHHLPIHGLYHIRDGWITAQQYYFSEFDRSGSKFIWATTGHQFYGPWGLMRLDGTWQLESAFEHVQPLYDDRAIVGIQNADGADSRDGLWGAVDSTGTVVIPTKFGWLSSFSGGYALMGKTGRGGRGFVDKNGTLVTGRTYEDAAYPDKPGGLRRVMDQGVWYEVQPDDTLTDYIPDLPEPIRVPVKREPDPRDAADAPIGPLGCQAGARLFRDAENWGMLGPAGEVLIPAIYPAIDCFKQGVTWVPIAAEKKWCPLGPDGKRRDRPACKTYYSPFAISHHGPETLADDPFDSSVLWMRAFLAVLEDPARQGPRLVGDGVQGQGEYEVRGRGF